MHIWYLNHYAAASNAPREGRAYFLARGLLNIGVRCSIVAASFHHLQKTHHQLQSEDISYQNVDDIPCLWLKSPAYIGNGFGRIKNMLSYARSCWKYNFVKLGYLDKPDIIIVTSVHPFHILAGIKWAKHYNAKLVFEVRDLWPLSLNLLLGMSKYHPLSLLLNVIERIGYFKSDLVVSVLSNALEYMEHKGVTVERFLHLPNGFTSEFSWADFNDHEIALKNIKQKYKHVIMHTGSMGEPNGLTVLIETANAMKQNSSIAYVFIGDGTLKESLIALSLSEHIYHFSSIPKKQIQSALSYADICYCGAQSLPELYKYGVSPNKIFDYMLAKKFILFAIDSPNNPVELADAGLCINSSSDRDLKSLIEDITAQDKDILQEKGLNGYNYLIDNHNFNELAKKLVCKLNSLSRFE